MFIVQMQYINLYIHAMEKKKKKNSQTSRTRDEIKTLIGSLTKVSGPSLLGKGNI